MAIWQFKVVALPEEVLLSRYGVLPPTVPMRVAEEFPWWSERQPPPGFEKGIDLILPEGASWSTSMRMWGEKGSDEAHVCYLDDSKSRIEEIGFRIDARAKSSDYVRKVCALCKQLGCVLITREYELLLPDEAMVLSALTRSTAKRYLDDPVTTLKELDHATIERRFEYLKKTRRT